MPVVPDVVPRAVPRAGPGSTSRRCGRRSPSSRIDYTLLNTSEPLDHALFQLPVGARAAEAGAMMSFLAPALLGALLAIAIPILVHLMQRERKHGRRVPVADVPAADSVPVGAAAAHPPLAAARAARAGARAHRRWRSRGRSSRRAARRRPRRGGAREVVICSIGPPAWATAITGRARRRPRAASFAASAPETAVRWCSSRATWRSRATSEAGAGALVAAIDRRGPARAHALRPGAARGGGPARVAPSPRAARLCSISDFQKSGWDATQDVKLPAGVSLTTVSVAEPIAGQRGGGGPDARPAGCAEGCAGDRSGPRHEPRRPARHQSGDYARTSTVTAWRPPRVSVGPGTTASVAFAPFAVARANRARDRAAGPRHAAGRRRRSTPS